MQTQQSNRGDPVAAGDDNGHPRNGGDGRWHLAVAVAAMDDNETTGDRRSMDAGMDFGREVARKRRQRLRSMAAGAGD